MGRSLTEAAAPPRAITKRSFWNRFPPDKETALRAVILTADPPLLAATLQKLQARVDGSPFVDLDLAETQSGVTMLASASVPTTVTISGTTLPLRLTTAEVNAILQTEPSEQERPT